ncbi:MAG TPA: vanadium-dependent haloperoxidase [Terriglobia bacterium]|nr:vanadium-dependent haloperoxidase [Terriglobia bacterium]
MKKIAMFVLLVSLFVGATPVRADELTDWTKNLYESALLAGTSPLVVSRSAAIMQSAVFDAVNGIERRYESIHVAPNAPRGASRRAAAAQAAYAILVRLYPTQATALAAKLEASLDGISSDKAAENSQSIARGIEWGQTVADAIWVWRSTDGFSSTPPPFNGGMNPGQWRPTPPGFLSGAGVQFATMTTWVINSPSQFRAPGPTPLTSAEYVADFNETKLMGRIDSAARSATETLYSRFWNASSANYLWNQVAVNLAEERHLTFSEKSRLLAVLNLAMADAAIGCWDTKYTYPFWRPVTAIPLAGTDGNGLTAPDPGWLPLLTTPNHPEYTSGHSCLSGAAGRVLSLQFGENSSFSLVSDSPSMAGVVRSFSNFTTALEEVKNARIFGGIHFRTACNHGQQLGISVADYVLSNALAPLNGGHVGQLKD